jgi:hypothetical protein
VSSKLIIRPFVEIAGTLPDASRHITFFGRLVSKDRVVNVDFSPGAQYDDAQGENTLTYIALITNANNNAVSVPDVAFNKF